MQQRKLLREAVKEALVGKTAAGINVESSRKTPVSQEPSALLGNANELVRIIVWTRSTKSRVFDESPRRYRHETEVVVEGLRQLDPNTAIDDDIDALENEILRALLVDETLGGHVDDFMLVESLTDYGEVGDRMIGATAITFTAVHYTTTPLPDTLDLPDFKTVNTGYNLDGQQDNPADRAQTIIEGLDA